MRIGRILSSLLLPVLLGACAEITGLDPRRSESPELGRGVALSLTPSRTQIAPGDTVRLVARLTNQNPHPVRIDFSSGCQVRLYVENAAGKVVYPYGGGWGCHQALTQLELEAGETREVVEIWTGQELEYEAGTLRQLYRPLPAGEYRAHAALRGTLAGRPLELQTREVVVELRRG